MQEAIGDEQADALLQKAYDGLQQSHVNQAELLKRAATKATIKKAAIGAATGLGIGGGSVLKHVLGGK